MREENLEEHMAVEVSITLAQHEDVAVHHAVEESFKTLHEDQLSARLRAKKKDKKFGRAAVVASLQRACRDLDSHDGKVQGRLGGSSEMGTIIGLFQPFRL
jgi:hypothetical protein